MTESEVVAEAPDVSDLLREGEALSRGRKYGEALDRFNRAIAMDPSSSMAWYNRGVLLEGQRDAKGAKQSFTICLDLEPDHAPATANLAVLLERMGDAEGAGGDRGREDAPERQPVQQRAGTAFGVVALGQARVGDRAVLGYELVVDLDVLAAGTLQTGHEPGIDYFIIAARHQRRHGRQRLFSLGRTEADIHPGAVITAG